MNEWPMKESAQKKRMKTRKVGVVLFIAKAPMI